MNPSPEGNEAGASPAAALPLERERTHFRALILSNPNYFGNLKASAFKPVKPVLANTNYEEIGCVGFQPQFNCLEAVIYVKQPSGYGGGICSAGTPEYVRFYLSFDNGATWQDQGVTGFTAYDIPAGTAGAKRLEYAVMLTVNPPKKFCTVSNILKARAILSWNVPPPPNDPDYRPVWGNVHDTFIQVEPARFFVLGDLLNDLKIANLPKTLPALDLTQPVSLAPENSLGVIELQALYKDIGVEPHRFALPEVHRLIHEPGADETLQAVGAKGPLAALNLNVAELVTKLFPSSGSTRYEELACVGLSPSNGQNPDMLVGVIRVKLPNGYSGGLCSGGSREYVTFWGDFNNNGTFETCLGTASVKVFDIQDLPKNGLEYAVFLPVDLSAHRRPCEQGAKVVRIRAILSWQVPPPCNNPNYVPVWGNRDETHIQIAPGPVVVSGDYKPYLESISGVAACNIRQDTGMAGGEKPFGGGITITGFIPSPPDITATPLKYQIDVRELRPFPQPPGPWQPLTNSFGISVIEQSGGGFPMGYNLTQSIDPSDGFYTYREDPNPSGGGWRLVQNRVLAHWSTALPMTGLWEIRVKAKDPTSGIIFPAGTTVCLVDGSTRTNVKVFLDQLPPSADLQITGFSRGGGPVQPAINCATFQVGDVIHGTYSSFDPDGHFAGLSLDVLPVGPASGATPSPSSRVYGSPDFVPTVGESNNWSLNTAGMQPCGYVVRMQTHDRTIANGDGSGWKNEGSVGFCLKLAG